MRSRHSVTRGRSSAMFGRRRKHDRASGGGNGAAAEAMKALDEARADLAATQAMSAEVLPKIERLKKINRDNHFAAWAWQSMGGES